MIESPVQFVRNFLRLVLLGEIQICHNSDSRPPRTSPAVRNCRLQAAFNRFFTNPPTGAEYIEYEEREKYTCFIKVPMLHPPRVPRTYGVLKGCICFVCLTACSGALRGFSAVRAAALGGLHLPAGQRRDLKNRFEPKGRSRVRFLRRRRCRLARLVTRRVVHVLCSSPCSS